MMSRCYKENYAVYQNYGAKGVTVDERWHNFENFLLDVDLLEGFNIDGILNGKLQLDKDIKIKGNKLYSKETCMFVTRSANSGNRVSDTCEFVAVSPTLEITKHTNKEAFCREHDLSPAMLWSMMNRKSSKYHKGWQFFLAKDFEPNLIRTKRVIKAENIHNGEIIKFSNMSEFSRNYNVCYSSIKDCLKGKQKRAGEWTFETIKEGD